MRSIRTLAALALALAAGLAAASLPTTTSVAGPYACDGTTVTYSVPYRFLDNAHLVVTRSTSGTTTTLVIGTDYSVVGAGGTSGTVTLVAGSRCGSGSTLMIRRVVPLTQPTTLSTQGPFNPKTIETALDRLTMQQQQLVAPPTGWPIVDTSTVTASGSTTPRSLAARAADIVNVRDFGARGDGTTNDTAAIQAAIDAVTVTAWSGTVNGQYAKGGGTVLFPPGVYRITQTLRVGAHTRLLGVGTRGYSHPGQIQSLTDASAQKGAVIYADLANPDSWALESATFTAATGLPLSYTSNSNGSDGANALVNFTHGVEVEGLFFRSGATPVYGAIRLNSSPNSIIRRCGAYGFKIGYLVSGSWDVRVEDVWSLTHWYGVMLLRTVNGVSVSGYFDRITTSPLAVDTGYQPQGVYLASDYAGGGLTNYQASAIGVYVNYAEALAVKAVSEHWDVAAHFVNADGSVQYLHTEQSGAVAVVAAAANLSIEHLYNQCTVAVPAFHIGSNATLTSALPQGNSSGSEPWAVNIAATGKLTFPTSTWVSNYQRLVVDANGVQAKPLRHVRVAATYGTTVAIDASLGNWHSINATNATAFTISSPTSSVVGECLTVTVKNTSGGALGTVTWGTAYKLSAWTSPANGYSRSASFCYDGVASWTEVSRTPADVPN